MSAELDIEQIATYSDEPEWLKISWKYADLEKATSQLHADIVRYKNALKELDGAGTSIMNGKERIDLIKDTIAQMEAATS